MPLESGEDFDNLKRFRSIDQKNSAKTFVIISEGDKTLPENLGELFKDAIQDKGPCIIWNIPKKIGFDPHFSDPLLERENLLNYGKLLVK